MKQFTVYIFLFFFVLMSCKKNTSSSEIPTVDRDTLTIPSNETLLLGLVDQNATTETKNLFLNLYKHSRTHIFLGHQDATKRGMGWANEQGSPFNANRSDIHAVTNKFPVVIGSDFLHITSPTQNQWFQYEKTSAQLLAIDAYQKGWVNSFAWHYHNPVSLGSFYWSESPVKAVQEILPGGSKHQNFKDDLKTIGDFAKSLIADDGKLAPFIFRPFHEFDGDWFWWGKAHCSADEYKQLFQFTVVYLRDSLQVRNILYAWSPDRNFTNEATYLERFPGNEYVDMVGMDNYGDLATNGNLNDAINKLNIMSQYAEKHHKLAALTETGLHNIPQSDWFTNRLLNALKTSTAKLSYVLLWANREDSYWTPPPGHSALNDFINFCNDPLIILSDRVPNLYHTTP